MSETAPPAAPRPSSPVPTTLRSARDYIALALATCGVGWIPFAPGTWGSAVGVGIYAALVQLVRASRSPLSEDWRTLGLLILIIVTTGTGIWAATRTEVVLQKHDPGEVVMDEVAGQLTTFLFVPLTLGAGWLLAGFVLFRFFDIWKPYPVGKLEKLEAGLGVMMDDLLAGFFAATSLFIAHLVVQLVNR